MKLKKIISRIERKVIFLLDGINTKLYMSKYNKWLKKNGVKINGKIGPKYIHHTVSFDGVCYEKIILNDNVVISKDVIILVHDFSIEAGLLAIKQNSSEEAYFLKEVFIGEGTFIGARTTILPGTKIGNNCIVGAGTVLPGKVYPDNSIIVGNPGKIIGNTKDWAKNKYKERNYLNGYF